MRYFKVVCLLLLGLQLFLPAAVFAGSDKVSGIKIDGVISVKEKTIIKKLKSKVGKPYSEEKIKADMQKILELGYFDKVDLSVDTATYKITFKVKEKPLVKKIVFKGNKKISTTTLKQDLPLIEKEYFEIGNLEKAKDKILMLYGDKGYPDCKLEVYQAIDEKTNLMTINIMINEGNRVLIEKVEVEGVKAFKSKKILGKMENTKKKKVYKLENLNKDIDKIIEFYKNKGYIQVEVGEPKIEYNKERTQIFVTIPIKEGSKYKVGTISFSGQSVYTADELKKDMVLKTGRLFKDDDYKESQQLLMDLYSDKGYLNARIIPKFEPDEKNGIMNVNVDINEGNIVYVGDVYVDGLASTKDFVIKRELTIKKGEVFSSSKIRRSMEKIQNLGFIDGVEPEILPTQKPDVVDLSFNITEGKPGMLSAGAGYSSIDQLVGTLQLSHINLLGRAQKLNLMWEFGARKQNYQINWSEPWFMDKPMSLGLGVFNTERLLDYDTIIGAYKEGRKGGSVSLGPRINDHLSLIFGYSYEEIRLFDIASEITLSSSPAVVPTYDINSIFSASIIYDTRDNVYDPKRGITESLSVALAGGPLGGNINYVKPTFKSSCFIPTFWKFVLSLNATFGMVQPFGSSSDVPLYEKFFIGGSESVRGYKYRTEIGLINGGKAMSVFNMEYKFPIAEERRKSILVGAFFVDAGGAWDNPGDFNIEIGNNDNQLKAGAGFGIRFTSPVFPLRLDWGYGFNHKAGDDLSQIYFTIGNVF